MRRFIIGLAAMLVVSAMVAGAAEVSSVNVVGFQNLTVIGHGSSNIYTLLAAPFTKIPTYKGTISSNSTTTIFDDAATWTVGQYGKGVTGQEATGKSTFFAEVSDPASSFEGRYFYILTNTANTLTIDGGLPADVGAGVLNGAKYKIVPANRVRDIGGEPLSPTLNGGPSSLSADNVLLWSGLGWENTIYYQTGAGGLGTSRNNHWTDGVAIVDDSRIDRDEGFFVYRRMNATTNIVVAGEVSPNQQAIVLGSGYSLIGGQSVVTQAIGQTTLTNTLKAGPSALAADNILRWTGNGWGNTIYFQTGAGGLGTSRNNHWTDGVSLLDSTFIFEAGKSYFFMLRNHTNTWERTSPLQ